MAQARAKEKWQHTSSILSLIANANRDPKKTRPFKPSDFNPFESGSSLKDAIAVDKSNIHILREAFTGRGSKILQK